NQQSALSPAGPVARQQDQLWRIVFPIAVVVFVLVQGLLLVALVRYRARSDDDPAKLPKQVAGNTRLEVMWTIVPALILVGIAVPTVKTIFDLASKPDSPLEVRVVGKQYWWEFEYTSAEPKGIVTANELVIPTGRDVYLTMESTGQDTGDPDGVIHSFWVPRLAGKQDVVPGHRRTMTIAADEPGVYQGQCAEFCGLSHANMRFAVKAVEPAAFQTYVQQHAEAPPAPDGELAARGEELFTSATCIVCHGIGYGEDQARVGPNLSYFAERDKFAGYILDNDVTEGAANVSAWLENPQAVKPGAQMPNLQLSDDDIEALVAYLATLSSER
ncbi:MAG: cytochrome c oxidase subunit II, partial [Euzebyales bacterium]|nr:cytochrome c oxidase subunit II [Euzebyales bacterium]